MQMMRARKTPWHAKHRTLRWWPHQTVCTDGMLYRAQHTCWTSSRDIGRVGDVWSWFMGCRQSFKAQHFPIRPLRWYRSAVGWLASASAIRNCHLCKWKAQQSFFFKHPALYALIMMGGENSIGKALQLVKFLNCLDSHTYQTQVVHLGKNWTSIPLPSWWATSQSQTDWHADRRVTDKPTHWRASHN